MATSHTPQPSQQGPSTAAAAQPLLRPARSRPLPVARPHYWSTPLAQHVHDDPFARNKLPYGLRLKGGILLEILPSTTFIGILATIIVLLRHYKVVDLSVSTTLISVLGFIVSLTVSFRNTTAYERYIEGRKLWDTMRTASRNLGRVIWLQV